MKKILSIALISAMAIVLATGCSGKSSNVHSDDTKVSSEALYVDVKNNEELIKVIKAAADKTDWDITEFKNNQVIAEKTEDGKTISSSILFYDGHVEFENPAATSDLRDAIEDELKNSESSH